MAQYAFAIWMQQPGGSTSAASFVVPIATVTIPGRPALTVESGMIALRATRGDSVPLAFAITRNGVPLNLNGYQVWCVGKHDRDDADGDAAFTLTRANGGVVVTADRGGRGMAIIQPHHSAAFTRRTQLHIEIQIKSPAGIVSTVASGLLTFVDDLMRTSS